MYQKLLKRTTIYCFVFFIIAMAGMFYYDANKIIVIADTDASVPGSEGVADSGFMTQYQLLMKSNNTGRNQFVIPLEDTIMAEDVQIQNHYVENELWIGLSGATNEFYSREYVTGNLENVSYGGYDVVEDVLWIKLAMKDIYEFESTMNNGKLTIKMEKPQNVYDKIVVIDAGHGGEDKGYIDGRLCEKDIALKILLLLQDKFVDNDIKVYYTRTEDTSVELEKRVKLANSVHADMLISIHTSFTEEISESGVTTVYNGNYFIQDFGSIDLADKLERSVVVATGAKAKGLVAATEEDLLVNEATVPVAQINVGYMSNEEERTLLNESEYQRMIADGIYDAIMGIYEER
ncbi:MAG: N-acetylmuramoyl-L-alanine amidase [Lachnospiraceae bacterium]|nr:N-acetylmuramoyl-L-alanine amidase [Lachnospiraceae bacterium]